MMTIEKTVVVPEDRHILLEFDAPKSFAPGDTVTFNVRSTTAGGSAAVKKRSLRDLCGSGVTAGGMEAYFERKRADRIIEDERDRRLSG